MVVMEGGMWSCCTTGAGFTFYTKPDKSLGDFTPDENGRSFDDGDRKEQHHENPERQRDGD